MGLPFWVYGEEDSEWEDRGPYLLNRKTGQKVPKGAAGGWPGSLTRPADLPPEELQRRLAAWEAEDRRAAERGGVDGQGWNSPNPFADYVKAGFGTGASPESFRERLEAANRGQGDENLEDRTREVTLPHWIDKLMMRYAPPDRYGHPRAGPGWLPREVVPVAITEEHARRETGSAKKSGLWPKVRTDPVPESRDATKPHGWPEGWENTYDPRWLKADNTIREDAPEEVHRGIDESAELAELRAEREDLVDGRYEKTRSPLVLRKRNENGTVTYVHALTGQPLFNLGEYGLNDPQGDAERDPYWRAGRRDW